MCRTYVSYLPTVKRGMVRQLTNVQSGDGWIKDSNDPVTNWRPTRHTFYTFAYYGHYDVASWRESWVEIREGDRMIFTSTSHQPAISAITWRSGGWWAWVAAGEQGPGHWTHLVVDKVRMQIKTGATCDNGSGCNHI